jgi:ribosomal protein L37E
MVRYVEPGQRASGTAGPANQPVHDEAEHERCDVCGALVARETYGLHCKIRCLNCGFTRDCSDP